MPHSKDHHTRPEKPAVPPTKQVPDAGALEKDDIKSVDLDPRSNGETDWQDEMPEEKKRQED